jgi:hypothetical protein
METDVGSKQRLVLLEDHARRVIHFDLFPGRTLPKKLAGEAVVAGKRVSNENHLVLGRKRGLYISPDEPKILVLLGQVRVTWKQGITQVRINLLLVRILQRSLRWI